MCHIGVGGKMAITTFAELAEVEKPTFETLSEILKEYAESGAAISGRVVVTIIRKMVLTEAEKNDLANSARVGIRKQTALQCPEEVEQYKRVIAALV